MKKVMLVTPNAVVNRFFAKMKGEDPKYINYVIDEEIYDIGFYLGSEFGFTEEIGLNRLSPDDMNKHRVVAFYVNPKTYSDVIRDELIELMRRRRGYEFYNNPERIKKGLPLFKSYVLWDMPSFVNNGVSDKLLNRSIVTLDFAISYLEEVVNSKKSASYCKWEAEDYTHKLVALYNQANKLGGHSLPDFGTDELITFLESLLHESQVDYRSAGKLMHYEKDHFYKFEKMSDFLNPDEVYTDKDNRIVWSTTKDRLGTHYIDCHLEDLLHEYMSFVWLSFNSNEDSKYDHVDATSSEDTMSDCIYADMKRAIILFQDGKLDDEGIDTLATMINMHRDIFLQACEDLGVEFKLV